MKQQTQMLDPENKQVKIITRKGRIQTERTSTNEQTRFNQGWMVPRTSLDLYIDEYVCSSVHFSQGKKKLSRSFLLVVNVRS